MNQTAQQITEAWNRQWKANLLSTCALHLDRETGSQITQGWVAFFAGFPGGAVLLDIGTGNGFLPLVAHDVARHQKKEFEIHGTDLARIDPVRAVPDQAGDLKTIRFHPETPSEKLPFDDEKFDAVTGQHALEYADIKKALEEVFRVLKKKGTVRFLIHAQDGEIIKSNTPKIEQCRYVLEESGLFELAETAVREGLDGKEDAGDKLQAGLKKTAKKFSRDKNTGDLMELLNLLWGAYEQRRHFPDSKTFQDWLAENRKETEAQMHRIQAMRAAALTENGMNRLVKQMKDLGFENARFQPVLAADSNKLIGWLAEGDKS